MKSRTFISLAVSLFLIFLFLAVQSRQTQLNAQSPDDFVPDEIILKFRPIAPDLLRREILKDVVADDLRQSIKEEVEREFQRELAGIGAIVIKVPEGMVPRLTAQLERNPLIEYAQPNYYARALMATNDPGLSEQWGLYKIHAADSAGVSAWDKTQGNSSVKVAVLDTGVQSSHPDLAGKVVKEMDFSGSTSGPDDRYGHGTHVAGSVAALTNNELGIAGVGFNTSIMNGKVLNDSAGGTYAGIAEGLIWAADNGARVINLSLGGSYPQTALEDAVNYAWNKGAVIVAAAGNSGRNGSVYPAAYSNVISVGATDQNDQKLAWSNYGSSVDVGAPGASIYSTYKNSSYLKKTGTSMSSSIVSGLAALVWASDVCSTNACVSETIKQTADSMPGGAGFKYGRVNALSAVLGEGTHPTSVPTQTPLPTSTATPSPTPTQTKAPQPTATHTPAPTKVPTSEKPTITVGDIEMWTRKRNRRHDVYIRVSVVDRQDGSALRQAVVSLSLTTPSGRVYSGSTYTNFAGQATFILRRSLETGTFTAVIDDVAKTGYAYEPTVVESALKR